MFSNLGDSNERLGRHGRRPPPNYRSRAVRIRLFLLVGMVMAVLFVMSRVGDPEFWSFMGFKDDEAVPTEQELAGDQVDTQAQQRPKAPTTKNAFTSEADNTEPVLDEPAVVQRGAEFQFTQQDGWRYVHKQLDDDQRVLLHKILKNARAGLALTDKELEAWNKLVKKLELTWNQFHIENKKAVAESKNTPADEKQIWQGTLEKSESYWNEDVKPALDLAANASSLNNAQSATLEETQMRLDAVELQQVRDNTHLSRIREKNAWFRLFDQLNTLNEEQLVEQSSGRVGFLQLFRQPKHYRGKLVTIRGTARLAYHVQAPSNIYGIEGYYVFWVEPRGMSDQLINVYALETPPGFPEIKDKDLDKEKTRLIEQVEFTGFFFKNYNYRTKAGSNLAPLVLAKVPTWERPAQSKVELPQTSYILLGVVVIALVAIGISVLAYVRSRNTSPMVAGYGISARGKARQLKELENEDVTDVGEQLRQLADSETTVD
jgi:hypothetical protein